MLDLLQVARLGTPGTFATDLRSAKIPIFMKILQRFRHVDVHLLSHRKTVLNMERLTER